MTEFAETLTLPEGKYQSRKMRLDRQPYGRLLLEAIDSGKWPRVAVVGCVQSGKTLHAFVIPTLYHLFEMQETIINGVPTGEGAGDKYRKEILPVIESSGFSHLLPSTGSGSRGGSKPDAVSFRNGAELKFMTGHGGDEKRSSYTSRCVAVTEADKIDSVREASEETAPIGQIESRTLSFESEERRIYLECTASISTGFIWREYKGGTASRIVCPCPHCRQYVLPEREHLVGWQDATSVMDAFDKAYFACPECGHAITPTERRAMVASGVLLHGEQTIDEFGAIHGDEPRTNTLGFRWNAFHNLFWKPGDIGAAEWSAERDDDPISAERKMKQFYWAIPDDPPEVDLVELSAMDVRERIAERPYARGVVPPDARWLTVGVDVGEWSMWFAVIAWRDNGTAHVVEYERVKLDRTYCGPQEAIWKGLGHIRERDRTGWMKPDGEILQANAIWVDSGHETDIVYDFCRECRRQKELAWTPAKGVGANQEDGPRHYDEQKRTGTIVKFVGEEYHIAWHPAKRVMVAHVGSNHWKQKIHHMMAIRQDTEEGLPNAGAMVLYSVGNTSEHRTVANHLTAEKAKQVFIPGKGMKTVFDQVRAANHYLDCFYLAAAAAHFCGFRTLATAPPPTKVRRPVRQNIYSTGL